jgi:hypothetical protein
MSIINGSMPFDEDAASAHEAAWKLCLTMANHFENKKARQTLLCSIIGTFLRNNFTEKPFGLANPDGVLLAFNGSVKCILEIRNEPGSSGDVYMQAACSYSAVASADPASPQAETGCPALILCIDGDSLEPWIILVQSIDIYIHIGPSMLICGGFKDGDSVVFEPLSHWCSMLFDKLGVRQEILARHLYAFKISLRLLFKSS